MNGSAVPLVHVVDGVLLGKDYLWGKEQVILNLMQAQAKGGRFAPSLAVFASCLLSERIEQESLPVTVLDERGHGSAWRGLKAFTSYLRSHPGTIVHTHGFKANVVGRIARTMGAPMAGLVATSHGFDYSAARLYAYNALDRLTARASDAVTMPDESMLRRFPRGARVKFIPNAIPDRDVPSAEERARGRARFAWSNGDFVVGAMGRVSLAKGVPELIAAANSSSPPVRWTIAGVGPMKADIDACDPARLTAVGYISPSDDFVAAIDVYLQPSRSEGLSLSLLQAMRAAKPIVATSVNATVLAIRDGVDGLLVEPRDPAALVSAVEKLRNDPALAQRLARSARERFEALFRIEAQAAAYDELYADVIANRKREEPAAR
jgi:glycosyltransferase involved in cell wall biosynthesis